MWHGPVLLGWTMPWASDSFRNEQSIETRWLGAVQGTFLPDLWGKLISVHLGLDLGFKRLSCWPRGAGLLEDGGRARMVLPQQPFPSLIQLHLVQNSLWLLQTDQDILLWYSGKCLSLGTAGILTERGGKDQGLLWVGCVPVRPCVSPSSGPNHIASNEWKQGSGSNLRVSSVAGLSIPAWHLVTIHSL